jgi:hypothetical protein
MEFKHTLEVLYNQADEIRKLAAKLEEAEEIRFIDLDSMLEKLRNIYDLVLDLETTLSSERKIKKQNEKVEDVSEEMQTPQKVIEEEVKEQPRKIEPENALKHEKRTPENESGDGFAKGVSSNQETGFISDRFKGTKHTLHEQMSGRSKQEDVSTQYKSKPITNIIGAIALNERFELINQLFNGDKAKFEHAMEVLNNAGSFVEAYNYLQENYKWDMNNEYVQRILELIRRKLIVRRDD